MYDLKELSRYVELSDKGLKFPHSQPRKIRLEVLAESKQALYVKDGEEKPFYIGTFEGFDIVQFNVRGTATLQATGGGVRVWTTEFQDATIEIPDAISFTRTMTRRQRNPELEAIQFKMQQNMEARLRQVQRDVTLEVSAKMRAENEERERERFERARAEEAERTNVGPDDDEGEGEDEPAASKPPAKPTRDLPGSGDKAKGQKLATKPAAQR